MNSSTNIFVGIDVSKAILEVAIWGKDEVLELSNDEEGHNISGRARYSSYRDTLYIAARLPEGTSATLTVEGYGEMEYVPYRDAYRLVVHTYDPPSTVTIISSEGPSKTIEVTRRW